MAEESGLSDLTFDELNNAEFKPYEGNPVVCCFGGSFVAADPSVLTPDCSHDKKWHLFCHTFFGVYVLDSGDGINFGRARKVVPRAMRPNINFIDGRYYLYYERTKPVLGNLLSLAGGKWKSEIYLTESEDLNEWTKPKRVLAHTRYFEKNELGTSLSNPYLLRLDGGVNRLYYSCGLTFIDDCGFSEPTHVSYAESAELERGFTAAEAPIISPDKSNAYLNLCSGCLKVYKLKDCYIGLQNGIYERDGKSRSAIILMKSDDGLRFERVKLLLEPDAEAGGGWMAQYVYASHLVRYGDRLRLYFNARNTAAALSGREHIGFCEAVLKPQQEVK